MDAPLPGIGPWDEIIRSPQLWHFSFRGPDVERPRYVCDGSEESTLSSVIG
jgi:hypothetical protein